MAVYADFIALPNRWTAVPVASEETILSPISGSVRIASSGDDSSQGIRFEHESAHLIRPNTILFVRPTGSAPVTLARITS